MTHSITLIGHYAECHYAECHIVFIVMLNVIMPSVVMLNVMAPLQDHALLIKPFFSYSIPYKPLFKLFPGVSAVHSYVKVSCRRVKHHYEVNSVPGPRIIKLFTTVIH
jgi:hypothetical protein